MSRERQLNNSDYSDESLDRLVFALMGRFQKHFMNGVEIPVTKTGMAEYLSCSERHVDKLTEMGYLTALRFYDGADPRYLVSEALEKLKGKLA